MSYKILFNSVTKTFFLIDFEKKATVELKTIKEDKKRFSCRFTREFFDEIEEVKLGDQGIVGDKGIPGEPGRDPKLFFFSCISNSKIIFTEANRSSRDIFSFIEKMYRYDSKLNAYFNKKNDLICYWDDVIDGIETGYFAIQDGKELFKWRLQEYNYQFVNVKK